MKIGFDAKRAFNNITGLGNYSRTLIRLIATYFPENEYVLYTPKVNQLFGDYFSKFPHAIIKKPRWLKGLAGSLWRSICLSIVTRKDKIDVYHGLSHEIPFAIQRFKIKTVVSIHDLIVWSHPEYFNFFDRIIYKKKQRYACQSADLIIAISEQTKKDILRYIGINEEKISVIYQTCDPIFSQVISEENKEYVKTTYKLPEQYILFVGTIEERKNLLCIIRALPFINDKIELVVVGKATEYIDVVNKEISRLGLENRVHYFHNADFKDFPALYSLARVFVYPSYYEGFGIPILEALQCGIPVITSNVSSLPEVGGDAALYINPDDFHALSQHVNKLLSDTSFYNACSEKSKIQSLQFSEEKIARDIWNAYAKLYDK